MSKAPLRLEEIAKTYDKVRYVLDGLTLAVAPGELVVLMGRSGSGKTTLLNIAAGLETPTKGRVLVGGRDIEQLEEAERAQVRLAQIGVVFQRFHLLPELTLQENVTLPMELAGRKDRDARAREMLSFFGLDEHADAFPSTLSGGETQRAAIARALGNEPQVLLADEPTANLDEGNARNALAALRKVADELGTAVLIATHDPIVEGIGDRVLHLVGGVLEDEREPSGARFSVAEARGEGAGRSTGA